MKYRSAEKEKRLTFGLYPDVSLSEARERRDAARRLIRDGIDPAIHRKQARAKRQMMAENTLEIVAKRWLEEQPDWSPRYATKVLQRFEKDVFPTLGKLPVKDVTLPLLLAALKPVSKRGSVETAQRLQQHLTEIFATAIADGVTENNPAAGARKALGKKSRGRRPAIVEIPAARILLARIEAQPAYGVTRLASRLLALTAARPGVVRVAAPQEFEGLDGPEPLWRVPAEKMKLTAVQKRDVSYEFVVPLSRQAVEVVQLAIARFAGHGLLFPSISAPRSPMSDSTLSKLYRDAGYAGRHVPHGWRSTFSTAMNALAAIDNRLGDREVIDLMLAHMAAGVEPIYNRYAYMPRRRELAQEYADLLMVGAAPASALLERERGSSPSAVWKRQHRA
jgi:integrase